MVIYSSIKVRFIGPTNHRGARWKVTDRRSSGFGPQRTITVSHNYSMNHTENPVAAAQAWLDKHLNTDGDHYVVHEGMEHDGEYYFTWRATN